MRVGTVCMSCVASTFVRCCPVLGDLVGPTSSESRRAGPVGACLIWSSYPRIRAFRPVGKLTEIG
ncbi:hypothetical protein CH063_07737, partial [Colletotrichum higginsianum]